MSSAHKSVLFVCLGNICRSPLAEGIFLGLAEARGLPHRFHVDSAGTAAYHAGEPPDSRSVRVGAAHGVHLNSVARQVTRRDFDRFDVIVAMDRSNRRSLERTAPGRRHRAEIVMMRDYDSRAHDPDDPRAHDPDDSRAHDPDDPRAHDPDVPDPYYGGPGGFERVYRILERSCEGLFDALTSPGQG